MAGFPSSTPDPRLARSLWQALVVGLLLCLAFPPLRGCHPWLGWMPFWLVLAPGIAWLLAHRRLLWRWRAPERVRGRRHRRAAVSQARRMPPPTRHGWWAPHAA